MVRRILVSAACAMVACESFGAADPAEGASDGGGGSVIRDGAAPGTLCATLPDAGFCDDFDTSPTLLPVWTKSSATGCDITVDAAEKHSAPRSLLASCTAVTSSNHIALAKLSFGRTLNLRFALFIGAYTAPNVRLVSFTSEKRTFALALTSAGLVAEVDVGAPPVLTSLAFAKTPTPGTWVTIRAEVFFDDKDGHVRIDVDENRVVDEGGLFTYPHGQLPVPSPLLFGAESTVAGGTAAVSFDDIVIDPATLVR